MAKAAKSLCDRCEHRTIVGEPFCRTCGCPTAWASHDERVAWEVAQYRHISATVPIGVAYENSTRSDNSGATKNRRRGPGKLFSRRSHVPQPATPDPQILESPEPVLRAVPDEPLAETKPVVETKPPVETKPAPRRVSAAKPKKAASEPVADASTTVLVLRLLNARVAELDAKVQELQGEVNTLRNGKRGRR